MTDIAKELFDKKDFIGSLQYMTELHSQEGYDKDGLKLNMAKCFYHLQRADLAEKLLYQIPQLDNNSKTDLALYKNAQGKFDEAYDLYSTINTPQAQFNLGWHLLRKDNFLKGMELLNAGRDLGVFGSAHLYGVDYSRVYNGGKHNTLAVLMEGGNGDELIFARWLPHVASFCNVMKVYCSKGMVSFFRQFGFDAYDSDLFRTAHYDRFVPSMSIPVLFKLDNPMAECVMPFLPSKTERTGKIGIKYRGNPEFEHDQFREIPIELFEGLEQYGELVDLQMDNILTNKGTKIGKDINTWVDTYNIVNELDLIVTSCTSIAHLTASMGKYTIVLAPLMSYFVWQGLPWYGEHVKVIKQSVYGSWLESEQELHNFLGGKCPVR
jgi:hypothetical protein